MALTLQGVKKFCFLQSEKNAIAIFIISLLGKKILILFGMYFISWILCKLDCMIPIQWYCIENEWILGS